MLSFYSLIDLKLSIFVVSNRTRNQITRLLIGPQRSHTSSFIINSYYTIIKYKIVVKKDKRIQCFFSTTTNTMFKI